MRSGVILFFIQVMLTFVAAFNMRSIAQANYEWTILSEIIAGLMIFLSVREIADRANSVQKCTGFILGSVVGSVIGIFLSKLILKQ